MLNLCMPGCVHPSLQAVNLPISRDTAQARQSLRHLSISVGSRAEPPHLCAAFLAVLNSGDNVGKSPVCSHNCSLQGCCCVSSTCQWQCAVRWTYLSACTPLRAGTKLPPFKACQKRDACFYCCLVPRQWPGAVFFGPWC